MVEPLVSLTSIAMEFSGVKALDGVDLDVYPGEVCCLVGENGSGKSTLIKIVSGLYAPTAGSLRIDGTEVTGYRPSDAIRAGIQVIYQDFSVFPNLTAAENIAFSRLVTGGRRLYRRREAARIAGDALTRLGVELDLTAVAGTMRMVDRQLMAIAAALVGEARLIIMDEPTTALSRREVDALLHIVQNLKRSGIAVVFVSHKLDEIAAISDRNIVIRNGRKVADEPAGNLDRKALIEAMTGRSVDQGARQDLPVPEDAPVLLELAGLGRTGAYSDVSLRVRAGEVLGITGLLGSGRDALALSLFGMLPATEGTVCVRGVEVRLAAVQDALRLGIGFVPEDRLTQGLVLDHSIRDNIAIRTVDELANRAGFLSPSRLDAFARRWVDELQIKTPNVANAAATLSGGNQQRVVLAKWLSAEPTVLVLNGPTVGVDVRSKAQIHSLLRSLAQGGMGVIVISDDVPELLDVCHRILLMRDGRVTDVFERAEIDEAQINALLAA